jgi:hypothetical protein
MGGLPGGGLRHFGKKSAIIPLTNQSDNVKIFPTDRHGSGKNCGWRAHMGLTRSAPYFGYLGSGAR